MVLVNMFWCGTSQGFGLSKFRVCWSFAWSIHAPNIGFNRERFFSNYKSRYFKLYSIPSISKHFQKHGGTSWDPIKQI